MNTIEPTYGINLNETWAHYSQCLSGNKEALILVISTQSLSSDAKFACTASFQKLGWGDSPCIWCTWNKNNPADLFSLVEGIDPVLLILCDKAAKEEIAISYRCTIDPLKQSRVFGRNCIAFDSMENLLLKPTDKLKIWHLFKQHKFKG